jgi:hypothetical protein
LIASSFASSAKQHIDSISGKQLNNHNDFTESINHLFGLAIA